MTQNLRPKVTKILRIGIEPIKSSIISKLFSSLYWPLGLFISEHNFASLKLLAIPKNSRLSKYY